jgi:hypothetical protein
MKMSTPWSPTPANKLLEFLLSLYEQVTHIPRGLEANYMGEMTRISRNVLWSTLRRHQGWLQAPSNYREFVTFESRTCSLSTT